MNYRHEVQRKAIHMLGASLGPLIYLYISRALALSIAIPLMLLAVLLDVLRQKHPGYRAWYDRWLGRLMRHDENKQLCGASYVLIAIVLCILVYPKPIAIAALLFLSISDALASLVGRAIGGPRWFNKSAAGSAAFGVSALVIALLCLSDRPAVGVVGAVVATIVEALPLRLGRMRLDDNLTVPMLGGAAMAAL